MGDEPYEKPEVRQQSVEEMLTEAQQALDGLAEAIGRLSARLEDLEAAFGSLHDDFEELESSLAEAERLVQKVTYVATVIAQKGAR